MFSTLNTAGTPYIYRDIVNRHTYCAWLVKTHATNHTAGDLDNQVLLREGDNIHEERIKELSNILLKKL